MDLYSAIRELHEEKKKLDLAIAALEAKQGQFSKAVASKRRGRKSMGHEERIEVSRRMRAYWLARRSQAALPQGQIAELAAHAPSEAAQSLATGD